MKSKSGDDEADLYALSSIQKLLWVWVHFSTEYAPNPFAFNRLAALGSIFVDVYVAGWESTNRINITSVDFPSWQVTDVVGECYSVIYLNKVSGRLVCFFFVLFSVRGCVFYEVHNLPRASYEGPYAMCFTSSAACSWTSRFLSESLREVLSSCGWLSSRPNAIIKLIR